MSYIIKCYPYKSSSNDSRQRLTLIKKAPYDKCHKELFVIYLHGAEQPFVAHVLSDDKNVWNQFC